MNEEDKYIFAEGAAGLALAASALAEAAQALSEAASALSRVDRTQRICVVHQPLESTWRDPENEGLDDKKNQVQANMEDNTRSTGANTEINTHRKDTAPERLPSNDQGDPTPCPRYLSSVARDSRLQREAIGRLEQLNLEPLCGLNCPGRFYAVLEDEFDALPLILAYAMTTERTICYVPTSGSLSPWRSIISDIISNRPVFSGTLLSDGSMMPFKKVVETFASSGDRATLLLQSSYLARANDIKAHSKGSSLVFWGLPGVEFWPTLIQAVQRPTHTLLILSEREYRSSTCQKFLIGPKLGSSFMAHPLYLNINSFEESSILTGLRNHIRQILDGDQHLQNMQTIYEELLESPVTNTTLEGFAAKSSMERIDMISHFMVRVFLRGCAQDGGLKRLGVMFGNDLQPNIPDAVCHASVFGPGLGTNEKPEPEEKPNTIVPKSSVAFTHLPGRWRIALRQDADTIPLVCYLASEHPKSICIISHSQSASPYGDLFTELSSHEVFTAGRKLASVQGAIERFSGEGVRNGLLLLRGRGEATPNFHRVKANSLIYWGLPTQGSTFWPTQVNASHFTHIYLIIPPSLLPLTASLVPVGDIFQEHPDTPLLNATGRDSSLQIMREKANIALSRLSHGAIEDIRKFYKPTKFPAYPFHEFIKKVMLKRGYSHLR